MTNYKKYVGERIKTYREGLNMSQEELAKRLGYSSKTSISKIELGEASVPTSKIHDFARVLNTTVDELLALNDVESERIKQNAIEINDQITSMQNILKMLSTMDANKIQQIEKIIKTFAED